MREIRRGSRRRLRGSAAVLLLAFVLSACGNGVEEQPEQSEPPGDGADEAAGTEGEETGGDETPPEGADEDDLSDVPLELVLGWFPVFHTATAFVADGAGFWEDQNLTVEMVRGESGAQLSNFVSTGQVDVSYAATEVVIQAQDQGRDLLQIHPLVSTFTLNTVVSNAAWEESGLSDDATIEERLDAFSRMTIGYTSPGSPTDRYSRMFMQMAGINPEQEGTLVSVGGVPGLHAALETGQIDAFMLTPPGSTQPELEGYGRSFIRGTDGEIPGLEDFSDSAFGARAEWLEDPENREAAIRLIVGLIRAAQLIHDDPETAMDHLEAYYPDMDRSIMAAGLEDMTPAIPTDPMLSEEIVQQQIDILFDFDLVEVSSPPSAEEGVLWRGDILEEAKARAANY
jgi:NitT/TauT family transport system substrate-binding protein